ncbi:MAG TPA: trans-aconitate 2-methyltransferase [Steroidobacteraceae bacterium]|nr:trans-aconitate 2-methyltransferase [Steroidobacteraceae bacterium]
MVLPKQVSRPKSPTDWSPASYLRFEDERTRPALDLLARVRPDGVRRIVDMGCGPGNSTELLANRYPEAEILGLDSSPAMLEAARQRLPGVHFELADAAAWVPNPDVDLVFANAVYQWIPGNLGQLARVLAALREKATLAVQMPDNLDEPSHRLMREVALAGPWGGHLDGAARDPLPSARAYYEAFRPFAARIDIWRTTYCHVLRGAEAIVDFVRSTGLRPFLDPLSEPERTEFMATYTARIAAAYPSLTDGQVLLYFPRLFLVAERATNPSYRG